MREEGLVVKVLASHIEVRVGDESLKARPRGKLRGEDIYVGDIVEVERGRVATIEKRLPRRNVMTRPFVANVDTVIMVVAPVPAPDFVIADKVLINAYQTGVKPVLVFNKCDLADKADMDLTLEGYGKHFETFFVSTVTGEGLEELKARIKGETVCFAGQSAVGKSSLINALYDLGVKVGAVSDRWRRGRNTTRTVELFDIGDDTMVVDTCGFSVFTLVDMDEEELKYYYDEFSEYEPDCRFRGCNHIDEPSCAVKQAVEEGRINRNRYLRYKFIFEELKERRKRKYD